MKPTSERCLELDQNSKNFKIKVFNKDMNFIIWLLIFIINFSFLFYLFQKIFVAFASLHLFNF